MHAAALQSAVAAASALHCCWRVAPSVSAFATELMICLHAAPPKRVAPIHPYTFVHPCLCQRWCCIPQCCIGHGHVPQCNKVAFGIWWG